ncbi:hypothetical protein K474DRAFT_1701368 [Panus rudis PR-1116 ss-1]|nr:hypothetical protein K474DRAFT_1701368 [Panus rudis PR-1116 ss-1]
MDPLAKIRSFPPAPPPNDDATAIRGNMSTEDKQLVANILAYHVRHYPGSTAFAHDVMKDMKVVEVNVRDVSRGDAAPHKEAECVFEITVADGMLNIHDALHGGCAAHMMDYVTFSSLFALGISQRIDASGVSQTMNITWYAPAPRGTVLRFVSTTLSLGGRIESSRAEVYNKATGRLLISGTQTIAPVPIGSKQGRTAKL